MNFPRPIRIVVAGAGFGGVYTFKRLHKIFHKNQNIRLILVNRTNYFLFTPLLHEVATGGVIPENIVEPLRRVLGCCFNEFYKAEITKIFFKDQAIRTTAGLIPYDYLVLALGAATNFHNIPGADEHSLTLKSLEDAANIKNSLISAVESASKIKDEGELNRKLTFAIVGGGPTGVELAAEINEFIKDTFGKIYSFVRDRGRVILISKTSELLPTFNPAFRRRALSILKKKGIEVFLRKTVVRVGDKTIEFDDNTIMSAEMIIWVAGIKPFPIASDVFIPVDELGRIRTRTTMQLMGYDNVFALGDIARVEDQNGDVLPAFAQVATKEAMIVADNIRLYIEGSPLKPIRYKHSGDLVSLGQWRAIAEIKGIRFNNYFAWWLWRTIYLMKMISRVKKIKVAIDWTINIFMPRDISEMPTGKKIESSK